MEQLRFFLAIALSFLVFFLWEMFFVEKRPPLDPPEREQAVQEAPLPVSITDDTYRQPDRLTDPDFTQPETRPDITFRSINVSSPLYHIVISEADASFQSYTLKQYREKKESDSPLKELVAHGVSTVQMGFNNAETWRQRPFYFRADTETDNIDVAHQPVSLVFRHEQNGFLIEKRYTFMPDSYLVKMRLTVENRMDRIIRDSLTLSLFRADATPGGTSSLFADYGFNGPSAMINNDVERVEVKKISPEKIFTGDLKWMAIEDRYFMSAIIPERSLDSTVKFFHEQNRIENRYVGPETNFSPLTRHEFEFSLFFGPKSIKTLSKMDNTYLARAIDFGWFDFIAKPCLMLMNLIHDNVIANYGIAIIILTIIVKLLLWPLGQKHYKSMNEMKKIQPLMLEIREKYKNDKKKMNEELMGLYRTYQINPLGGCLPMLLQIPIFIALYRMLYEAIELRHAPFIGWITDLSAPERLVLFDVGFKVPLMEPPAGIPVLTLIMGGTMFWQQKMTPPPGDPMQAKIMMWMPVFLIFIFLNLSSGLVLYWLVSNVLSIVQHSLIMKKAEKTGR